MSLKSEWGVRRHLSAPEEIPGRKLGCPAR